LRADLGGYVLSGARVARGAAPAFGSQLRKRH